MCPYHASWWRRCLARHAFSHLLALCLPSTASGAATLAHVTQRFFRGVRFHDHLAVMAVLNIRGLPLSRLVATPEQFHPPRFTRVGRRGPAVGSGAGHLPAMNEGSSHESHLVVKILSNKRLKLAATAIWSLLSRGRGQVGAAGQDVGGRPRQLSRSVRNPKPQVSTEFCGPLPARPRSK